MLAKSATKLVKGWVAPGGQQGKCSLEVKRGHQTRKRFQYKRGREEGTNVKIKRTKSKRRIKRSYKNIKIKIR